MSRVKKTTKGKQKIEIKKIDDEDARYISFSKRRNGVFAKASDLSTLCGTDLALVIFSPTGRPHSFGSPTVEAVADRFLAGDHLPPRTASHAEKALRRQVVQNLSQQVMDLTEELEAGKAKRVVLDEWHATAYQGMEWALEDVDGKSLPEIDRVKEMFEQLKIRADARVREHLVATRPTAISHAAAMTSNQGSAGASWSGGGMMATNQGGGFLVPQTNKVAMAAQPPAPIPAMDPTRMMNSFEPIAPPMQPNPPPVNVMEFEDITGLLDGFSN